MVANVAVALSPSLRASRYGRSNSPARAGSSAVAANPMIVVLRATDRRTRPIGASRYCQRSARSTYVRAVTTSARHDQIQPGAGHLGADVPQVGVSQEKREQPAGHEQYDDRPQVLAHAGWA